MSVREAGRKGKRSVLLIRLMCLINAVYNSASFLLSDSVEQNDFLNKLHERCVRF